MNNNAAALVLAATALAAGREIVISRGELIEIGDRFRLPDLLTATGARLREVGTTNRTTVGRLRAGDRPRTPASSSRSTRPTTASRGSPGSAAVSELAALDVPAGARHRLRACSPRTRCCPTSRTPPRRCADGANLVTASGDKLLGGPQAGLLLGDEPLVRRLLRHPLARALRVDKLTLAALEATLAGPPAARRPRAGRRSRPPFPSRAERIVGDSHPRTPSPRAWWTREAAVGGGGAPGVTLPSAAVALPEDLARAAAPRATPSAAARRPPWSAG